jgi:FtsH-binding integral membrane protein
MIAKTLSHTLRTFRLAAANYSPAFRFSNSRPNPFTSSLKEEQLTTNHFISKNVGLNRFMQKVYNTTGLALLGALGTSYITLSLGLSAVALTKLSFIGFAAGLVGIIGSSFMKPEYLVVS